MTVQMTMDEYKELESARNQLEQIKEQVKVINNSEGIKRTEEMYRLMSALRITGNLRGYI